MCLFKSKRNNEFQSNIIQKQYNNIFQVISFPETASFVQRSGLAISHDFPVIKHIEIKSGRRSAILHLIKLNFFTVYPYMKPHILLNSNGLAIWQGFPDITYYQKYIIQSVLCIFGIKSGRRSPI